MTRATGDAAALRIGRSRTGAADAGERARRAAFFEKDD
jgi:hypothetical protein